MYLQNLKQNIVALSYFNANRLKVLQSPNIKAINSDINKVTNSIIFLWFRNKQQALRQVCLPESAQQNMRRCEGLIFERP